jgi:hypothetical protein
LAAVRSTTAGGGQRHADVYVINGSEASQASGVSRFSRRSSANYEPLPHNGIGRVRHTRLTEEELDRQSAVSAAAASNGGGQKRSPDWTGSRERKAASKIAKVRYLYQARVFVFVVAESVSKTGKLQPVCFFLIPTFGCYHSFLLILSFSVSCIDSHLHIDIVHSSISIRHFFIACCSKEKKTS